MRPRHVVVSNRTDWPTVLGESGILLAPGAFGVADSADPIIGADLDAGRLWLLDEPGPEADPRVTEAFATAAKANEAPAEEPKRRPRPTSTSTD